MSRRRRRRRARVEQPRTEPATEGDARGQLTGTPAGTGWRWRTFPVYFAFSIGAFIGLYLGVIAQLATDAGNTFLSSGIFISIALMLGLAFSRLSTRWLTSRRWIRQREAASKR